jgi:hypothetical protein
LRVEEALELGSDDRSDEVTLQIVMCAGCGLESVALYEESRRGALDEEAVHHAAFPADEEALADVRSMIASCRDPEDADCGCRGHQRAREMMEDQFDPPGIDWEDPQPILFVRVEEPEGP